MKNVLVENILETFESPGEVVIKKNCWEVMDCGRGPANGKADVCPVANEITLNGIHDGINAGRACWVVAGTMCNGEVSGTFAKKMDNCLTCPFYRRVREEENEMKSHQELLIRLKKY